MDRNRGIGKDNKLPWHLPSDMLHFKQTTTNHVVIMGRKTYESIGKPLPNRTNVVITRNTDFADPRVITYNSVGRALRRLRNVKDIFVIGGSEIYKAFMPYTNKLYLTVVDAEFDVDTYFDFNEDDWIEVKRETLDTEYTHSFIVYKRKY